ncbi:long-chain fatty acid--CoA ligase [Parendozoicomonas sp. Alg238-R29]|uniref:long-chain-fatty-acid--CoA ligase n=1 Tax=Parendozoicomonas sp. Alg238-R29 TaxID=2993446 RepID=UPI00248D46F8|nr:long-chain fatty acid--CoA ligase [Parendozoicomonas sp. Alg238-R29]
MNRARLTYAQLDAAASQVASGLIANGLQPGDRVALSCPNLPCFPIAYYGILKAGGVVVPLNVLLRSREIEYHLQDSSAKFLLCFEGTVELPLAQLAKEAFVQVESCEQMFIMAAADQAAMELDGFPTLTSLMAGQSAGFDYVQREDSDIALLIYTSGTTGYPKGAMLTHTNIAMNAMMGQALLSMSNEDVILVTLPLFHCFGQIVQMVVGLAAAATLVLVPRFDPEQVLALMEKEEVTSFAGVPTMYIGLLSVQDADEKFDLKAIASKLRINISGGAAIPVEVIRRFEEKYQSPILEGYGLSETSPIACFNSLERERIPGSVGQPVAGIDIRIVDENGKVVPTGEEGEIIIRGHNIMAGYFNNTEKTAETIRDGWFYSGDIGRMDESGNLYIVDRVKDMIIRGGYNVYPRELEEVLMTHPHIASVAVVGLPHDVHGEEVMACIVPHHGMEACTGEITEWAKERIAAHKYPRVVQLFDELPMTATGKILKRELREQLKEMV